MVRFTVLASGSKGNSTVVSGGRTRILVDCGLSCRELFRRMKLVGEEPETLDAILITHEHSDHVGGLVVTARRLGIPVYFTEGTHRAWMRWLTPQRQMTYAQWLEQTRKQAAERRAEAIQDEGEPDDPEVEMGLDGGGSDGDSDGSSEKQTSGAKALADSVGVIAGDKSPAYQAESTLKSNDQSEPGVKSNDEEALSRKRASGAEALADSIGVIAGDKSHAYQSESAADQSECAVLDSSCDAVASRKEEPTWLPAVEYFQAGEAFEIGDIAISPFTIPHDAADPVGFVFRAEGVRMGFATDLGYIPPNVKAQLQGVDLLLLESNHDLEMLRDGPYPWAVKQRVLSRVGHLSNEAAASFLEDDYDGQAAYVILAHLSESNNLPELARVTAERALNGRASLLANRLLLAAQHEPLLPIAF